MIFNGISTSYFQMFNIFIISSTKQTLSSSSRYHLLPPFCPIKYVSTFLIHCCDVRTLRFPNKTMFGSFVSTVVCRGTLILLCLFAHSCVQHFVLSYVFTFLVPYCYFHIKTSILLVFTRFCLCLMSYLLFVFICVKWSPRCLDYMNSGCLIRG